MITLALILVAAQGGSPELSATADRYRLMVGEELIYTVKATSSSEDRQQISQNLDVLFASLHRLAALEQTDRW